VGDSVGALSAAVAVVELIRRERIMSRPLLRGLGTMLAIGITAAIVTAPAAARATGKESFRGVLLASGESGTRSVFSTFLTAEGVFNGAGRIVEVANRPRDPDTVSRDDLVFAAGKMHLISTNKSVSVSIRPATCAVRITIRQTAVVRGGTGRFRHAAGRFVGGVHGRGVAPRSPDGTCSQQGALLLEIDAVSGRGTLSF
jgi:hypothetical protein